MLNFKRSLMLSLLFSLMAWSFPSMAQVPACEIDIPQGVLGGILNNYELTDDFGMNFGVQFGGTKQIPKAQDFIKEGRIDLSLYMSGALTQSTIAADVEEKAQANIDVEIDFASLAAQPMKYFSTPLAILSGRALNSGIQNLGNQFADKPWIGRIVQDIQGNSTNLFVINAGTFAGVQIGDTFEVYNVQHYWQGAPCNSLYYGYTRKPDYPVSTIQVTETTAQYSFAVITGPGTLPAIIPVQLGAEVVIKHLVGDRLTLKKKILLSNISSPHVDVVGGGQLDLGTILSSQLRDTISQTGRFVLGN